MSHLQEDTPSTKRDQTFPKKKVQETWSLFGMLHFFEITINVSKL
jgi:hypothetical protein